jgi:hypothetical protein
MRACTSLHSVSFTLIYLSNTRTFLVSTTSLCQSVIFIKDYNIHLPQETIVYITIIDTKGFVSVPLNRTADGFNGILCAFLQIDLLLLCSWGGELCLESRIYNFQYTANNQYRKLETYIPKYFLFYCRKYVDRSREYV